MATPSTTFTELVTTTLREHPAELADNISAHNALYRVLKKKGKITTVDGGYEIVRPLDYGSNQTYQRYSGYDVLNISAGDVLSAAKYDWMQAAVHVTASGRELRINSGKNQMISLVKSRVTNAKRTAANNFSVDLYSSGLLANQIGGLGHMITSDGTGTVGGIDASTWTFWKNKFYEATATPDTTNIRTFMNALWLSCVRGTDKPDIIIASHDLYAVYEATLQGLQRYMDAKEAESGFETVKYKGATVYFDSNANFATTAQVMFFLNTDYLEVCVHRDANWTQVDDKISVNQDAVVIPIIWQGNLVCSNRSLQGKLKNES